MYKTAFALSTTVLTAILGMVQAAAQEQAPGVSLAKTGFLGFGVEPGFIFKGVLLDRPSVLKELKVTEAQKVRLKQAILESDRLAERSGRESRAIQAELRASGDRQALAEFEQRHMMQVTYALTLESDRPVLAVLDSHQRSRLEELQLQAEGPAAFMRPGIQDRLRMSPEQADAIKVIYERGRQAMLQSATLPSGAKPIARGLTVEKRPGHSSPRIFGKQVESVRALGVIFAQRHHARNR